MKNLFDAVALRHRLQVVSTTGSGRLLPLLLCFVLCAVSMRAENRPSEVYFHYDAGWGWQYNQSSTYDNDSWYIDLKPTKSDVFVVLTNRYINDTSWDGLTKGGNTVFHGSDGGTDSDGNWKIGYDTSKSAYLYGSGPGHCIHITDCPTGQTVRIKLSYSNGSLNLSSYSPSDTPVGEMVTLYMHFEEDYLKKGKVEEGEVPFCHVFTYDNGGSQYTEKGSAAERMTLVNKTYQIWAYSLPASEAAKYNRVRFFFNNKEGGSSEYESGWSADRVSFDEANWTKYIYAVHSGTIAVQTYMTYEEFLAEAEKGYRKLYVTGGGDTGASILLTREDGSETYLGWDPANPTVVSQWKDGDPLFFMRYLPTTVNGNARFKLSWMDVKTYKEMHAGAFANGERDWATYDLGIIGVDDEMCEKNQNAWGDNLVKLEMATAENGWGTSRTSFFVNKALPLLEYNQYDWTMNETLSNSGVQSGSTYWVVVDMHPDCRTVTLCTFDPNPQVRVNASEVSTTSIDADVVASIYNGGAANHFNSSETNGHILTTDVNHINGSVNIIGGKDKDGNDVQSAEFKKLAEDARLKPTYTVSMNGTEVFEYVGLPQTLKIDYMPLAAANSIGINAMYTSEVTQLHFHEKPGNGTVTTQAPFVAPADQEVEGTFIPFYEYPGKKGNGNITEKEYRATFHICGEVPYQLAGSTNLAYYPDFTLNGREMGLMHDDYRAWLDIPKGVSVASVNHNKYDHETDSWNAARHDWSGNIRTAGSFPFIVYNHHNCNISGAINVPAADYTGKLYAIYPVVYRLHPTVTVANDMQGAPRRAAESIDSENYGLVNYVTEGNLRIRAEQGRVTTGVEDIVAGDDSAVEYYTLQGVRVEGNPAPGIYIRVQGQSAAKVYIK